MPCWRGSACSGASLRLGADRSSRCRCFLRESRRRVRAACWSCSIGSRELTAQIAAELVPLAAAGGRRVQSFLLWHELHTAAQGLASRCRHRRRVSGPSRRPHRSRCRPSRRRRGRCRGRSRPHGRHGASCRKCAGSLTPRVLTVRPCCSRRRSTAMWTCSSVPTSGARPATRSSRTRLVPSTIRPAALVAGKGTWRALTRA
jgi:hypothetical protein